MIDDDELMPRDPDWDFVPTALELLAGVNRMQVTVIDGDDVSRDTLVIVPGVFGHARRLQDGDLD